jgi:hypothetical protein
VRPLFPLNGSVDVVYVGEGSIGKGYPADIDPAVLGFPETFRRCRLAAPGRFHTETAAGKRATRWCFARATFALRPRRRRSA